MSEYISDRRQISPYLDDESSAFTGHAERVYRPTSMAEIASVLCGANSSNTPVTVSGAGTSITGARPRGCTLAELDLLLQRVGLLYPPDPTERTATVGGSVATNASGARSFCFGATRGWVEALDLVLPDGTMTTVRRGERARGRNLDIAGLRVTLPSRRHYRWPHC